MLNCSALSRFEFKFTPYLSFDAANFPFHCTISINWMKYLLQQQSLYTSNMYHRNIVTNNCELQYCDKYL
ncbi:hypothetical protein T06_12589 [Trichinella sp. T6]|nr:hypothetical protein T06_12589 [Trichinella sp. T6]KRX74818.1 hypothetical protein T06_12589 [Trichinella sp. T6]